MTTVLLIRHALCDGVGRVLAGRAPGTRLNREGRLQAERLAERLARLPVRLVYASPLERARETAEPLAGRLGVPIRIEPDLNELDFGDWTGRPIERLDGDPAWRRFNVERATARIPGGETMEEVVARTDRAVRRMTAEWGDGVVAAVTHGDVIRGFLAAQLQLPLDRMLRLEVSPASASVVVIGGQPRVSAVNWRADALGELPLT